MVRVKPARVTEYFLLHHNNNILRFKLTESLEFVNTVRSAGETENYIIIIFFSCFLPLYKKCGFSLIHAEIRVSDPRLGE